MSTATIKQTNFAVRLFNQAQQYLEVSAQRDPSLAGVASEALTPHKDTLAAVLGGQEVDRRAISPAIDALLALNKRLASAAVPVEYPALGSCQRVIANKFRKDCWSCDESVDAGEGLAVLDDTGWTTWCKPCAKGEKVASTTEPAAPAEPSEPAYEPKRGDVHVVDGEFYRVSISQSSRRPYLTKWAGKGYVYAAGAIRTLNLSDDTLATAEQAAEFGKAYECCCFCARDLDTPESITVGYGPTCAAKRNLPWGVK